MNEKLKREYHKTKDRIIVAGHICLDITPIFSDINITKIEELLQPGKLIQMKGIDIHIGGVVANTGLALKKIGANVVLMGKIGDDDFGDIILSQLKRYNAQEGMIVSKELSTSYSIVISPIGIDRIFLHNSGANNHYFLSDINIDIIKDSCLFHFGYPPLMSSLYNNNGIELIKMFKKIKSCKVATSLDLAMIDPDSEAGKVNWIDILQNVLPFVDFFVPSIEEIAFILNKKLYDSWNKKAKGRDIISLVNINKDVKPLAEQLLNMGAKIVLIKCGSLGMYLATSSKDRLIIISESIEFDVCAWENIRFFESSYKPNKILSATGAGDTSIAAFLYAFTKKYSYKECLELATATGASCVETYDALSGLRPFEELKSKINKGWEKNKYYSSI